MKKLVGWNDSQRLSTTQGNSRISKRILSEDPVSIVEHKSGALNQTAMKAVWIKRTLCDTLQTQCHYNKRVCDGEAGKTERHHGTRTVTGLRSIEDQVIAPGGHEM